MDSCNQCCGSELIFLDSDSDPQTFLSNSDLDLDMDSDSKDWALKNYPFLQIFTIF
jgi:hypothetical protein